MGGFIFTPLAERANTCIRDPGFLDDEAMKLSARTFIMEKVAPKGLPNMKATDEHNSFKGH